MPLIYAFVARETTILADYTPYSGNFSTVAIECLSKITNPESKFTIACDKHTFNFLVANGFVYLVVADEAYGRQIPFAFLDRIKDEFEEKFMDRARTAPPMSLKSTFGPRLKSHMEYCMAHPEEISKIAAVQKKVMEVKDVMVENIEKVLDRGEKIELLVDKTDDLRNQAEQFQRAGKQLRTKMWWQKCKVQLIIACLLIVLAVVIFLAICFTGQNCLKSNSSSNNSSNTSPSPPFPPSPPSPPPPPPPSTVPLPPTAIGRRLR